jgi:hypothetical protein
MTSPPSWAVDSLLADILVSAKDTISDFRSVRQAGDEMSAHNIGLGSGMIAVGLAISYSSWRSGRSDEAFMRLQAGGEIRKPPWHRDRTIANPRRAYRAVTWCGVGFGVLIVLAGIASVFAH